MLFFLSTDSPDINIYNLYTIHINVSAAGIRILSLNEIRIKRIEIKKLFR